MQSHSFDIDIWNTGLVARLGITPLEGDTAGMSCQMEVTDNLCQPFGALHGGATAALIETTASIAAFDYIEQGHYPVGVGLEVHHYHAVNAGTVVCTVKPTFTGRRLITFYATVTHDDTLIADGHVNLAVTSRKNN
ncbi:MAG: PaaI family thioesterase [Actinomycetaceae bacterium]|nr:PaaI family thioesterase [Actinomycetaceae bacterium]